MSAMKFCVYRQWKGSLLQEVLEYFHTVHEAKDYASKIRPSNQYTVMVGEFV
jgi:hypothetical protein